MRSKIIIFAMLATVVVGLSVLAAAKYLDIQPRLRLTVSSLENSAVQLCSYLNNNEFLLAIDKIFAAALVLLLIILRALMLRIVAS